MRQAITFLLFTTYFLATSSIPVADPNIQGFLRSLNPNQRSILKAMAGVKREGNFEAELNLRHQILERVEKNGQLLDDEFVQKLADWMVDTKDDIWEIIEDFNHNCCPGR